jgi:hypothetical protein
MQHVISGSSEVWIKYFLFDLLFPSGWCWSVLQRSKQNYLCLKDLSCHAFYVLLDFQLHIWFRSILIKVWKLLLMHQGMLHSREWIMFRPQLYTPR